VKFLRKLLSYINDSFHEPLLHHLPESLIRFSKYKVEFLIIRSYSAYSIIVKEDFEEICEQFDYNGLLLEIFMPTIDSFVEDPHNCQQVLRLLLVVVET
jgi:hypothetical protein